VSGFHYEIYNEYEPSSTLWESWNVNTQVCVSTQMIPVPSTNCARCPLQKCITCETSRNHHYRASINTFLRKYVAGLDMTVGTAAWSSIRVRPEAALLTGSSNPLPSAAATIDSHRGTIHAAWQHQSRGNSFALNVTIPAGAQAEIHVPIIFGEATEIQESGYQVWGSGGATLGVDSEVRLLGDDGRFVAFAVGCGQYFFHAARSAPRASNIS
jgi:hypothetical protein